MKWLWLAFGLFWAVSIVLDTRRRDHASRSAPAASGPSPRERDAGERDAELPALLLPRSSQ